jgi:hypothetical protein
MFVLESSQVQYCQAARAAGDTLLAIAYGSRLFIKAESFAKDELDNAIKFCREVYLDGERQIPCIVLKEDRGVGIWQQDKTLTFIKKYEAKPQKIDPVTAINLDKLVTKMRGTEGVEIKNRMANFKLHSKCFVGSEAVDWIVKVVKVSREDAIKIGQRLINAKLITESNDRNYFKDEPLFYRFLADEDK